MNGSRDSTISEITIIKRGTSPSLVVGDGLKLAVSSSGAEEAPLVVLCCLFVSECLAVVPGRQLPEGPLVVLGALSIKSPLAVCSTVFDRNTADGHDVIVSLWGV